MDFSAALNIRLNRLRMWRQISKVAFLIVAGAIAVFAIAIAIHSLAGDKVRRGVSWNHAALSAFERT